MKITNLTTDQIAALPFIRDEWVGYGLSAERINRDKVESALAKVYAQAAKPKPKFTILLKSPVEVAVAIALLRSSQVSSQVRDQVWDQVEAQVRDIISNFWRGFGQFDAGWLSFYSAMNKIGIDTSKLDGLFDLTQSSGWSVLFWDWAFISDRPTEIHRDDRNNLHREDGPALSYADGFSIYAVHGVRVPSWIIENKEQITSEKIDSEDNAEIRRVMMDIFTQERYIQESGAVKVSVDDFGTLWRKDIKDDEPLVMVEVLNSTAEPDGSWKTYWLRVPPTMRTPREAIAWTFGMTKEEYAPAMQS